MPHSNLFSDHFSNRFSYVLSYRLSDAVPVLLRPSSPMRRLAVLCASALHLFFAPGSAPVHGQSIAPIPGFTTAGAAQQRALEARFDAGLQSDHLREWMKRLSAHPHHIGSRYNHENAEFIASLFRQWGYQTEIERFDVLFPTPKRRMLELIAPARYRARLDEPSLQEDATSADRREMLPPYNAYSVDGDVTGELVYVNYGVPDDYKILQQRGVDVKGKIVIARYGGSWRGIKPKVAAEHGAIGCLIYSDPRDDGYAQGEAYPEGPYRHPFGAQRGSVADMPLFPGDPLTPGVGAKPGAARLDIRSAPTLTKIPTLPIAYADALPLLRALKGDTAPESWRGALPITYRIGSGPARVHLKLAFDWKQRPLYDVIARLPGTERPDEWVVRGNHYDAWVFGAQDPISGAVALLEEARMVGELAKSGYRPKRTLVYACWDGEEPGLLGSTEWVETHAEELDKKAILYVNSDSNGRGYLSAGGSHTLQQFVDSVAHDVSDPEKRVSVAERARAQRLVNGSAEVKKETKADPEMPLGALGSGSDFTPFLQHLGIASLDIGYGGESGGGIYHSIYDSFDWYMRFGDPEMVYGIALTQTAGRIVLRAANADLIPFRFSALSNTIEKYGKEIAKLADTERDETKEKSDLLAARLYELTFNPRETHAPPAAESAVPAFDFTPITKAIARLKESAKRADSALAKLDSAGRSLPVERAIALDGLIARTERAMLSADGLPRRSWFRHQIYAPGFYTGYGVKTLPGVREAIEERFWEEAKAQIPKTAAMLNAVCDQIDRVAEAAR